MLRNTRSKCWTFNDYYNRGEQFYPEALADFERYVELAGENADPNTVELLNTLRGD